MKFLLSIIVVAMLSITNSITAQNNKITVTVVNATSDTGKIGYALYTKDNFMRVPVVGTNGKIVNGKVLSFLKTFLQENMQLSVIMIKITMIKWIFHQTECH
ncbi:MAG: hypothetical protein V3V28_04350 [Polaribacter sp.]|uniref:hypothetical protein n=1 Tax=Polaribacter sp. TaxID=1920175 RepID=UPI002F3588BC